jgi:hypothetical protein
MGSSQSIPTASEITYAPRFHAESDKQHEEHFASSKNGPKTQPNETNLISLTEDTVEEEDNSSVVSTTTTESDDDVYYSSDEDDELDEFIAERKRILADSTALKKLAIDYLRPEQPVIITEPTVFGRNYFGRGSAPTQYDDDDDFLTTISRVREGHVDRDVEEERERILEEAAELKAVAEWYHTPTKPVVRTDVLACGRNYYARPSALEYGENEEVDDNERERVLKEASELKKVADWHLYPEKPIASEARIILCGRNYYSRPSASEYECEGKNKERERVLSEMALLKQVVDWHLHLEKKIEVDPASFGRNYFSSLSAPKDEDDNVSDERERVLSELAELKKVAEWHLHPEKKIEVDPASFGRNYFSSLSAPEDEDDDLSDERERVLSEMAELKKVAEWHLHPEKKIEVDPASFGRNYFLSVSAPEDEDDLDDERERVLSELASLKQVADWHLHPEKKIKVDPASFGRNYFSSLSAPEDDDLDDERERVLSELTSLKEAAEWHLYPEKKIEVDPASFGRNYFSSLSAPEDEDDDLSDEGERVLSEMAELKKVAEWHLHPEKKIEVDPTSFGRNYFSSSALEDDDVGDERERVLSEMADLKKVSDWHLHPEKKIEVDPTSFGRNYFSSSSPEDDDVDNERERVLSEMASLKEVADWHLHPEKKIEVDPASFGRNYFSSSADPAEDKDDDLSDEGERVLSEMVELKKVVEWHLHPEKKIEVDPISFGRNYFSSSAPEDDDVDNDRDRVLSELAELKKVAEWHLHPEKKIEVDPTSFGRNYFSSSASEDDDVDDEQERVLSEMASLKEVADWHLHPEKKIQVDPTSFGRNYFSSSADPGDDERERVLMDAFEMKKVADWHLHPDKKIEVDPASFGRNYFSLPSAPEDEDDFDDERECVLSEMVSLKEVADWHLHPEKPVTPSSVNCTRNYFDRPSANDDDLDEECELVISEMAELKQVANWYLRPEKPVAPSRVNCARNYFDRPSAKGNYADYVHTQGYANHTVHMEDHYVMHHDDYHHYDYHHDDISHGSFQSHGDHFDMDEDVFHGFRESINAFRDSVTAIHDQHIPIIKEEGDGKEGNLSRSPSSIMLFEEPAM